jgi:hypothetical protein
MRVFYTGREEKCNGNLKVFSGSRTAELKRRNVQCTDTNAKYLDTEGWTPPKGSNGIPAVEGGGGFQPLKETDTPQRQDNRPWLYLAIFFTALLCGALLWRKTKRK